MAIGLYSNDAEATCPPICSTDLLDRQQVSSQPDAFFAGFAFDLALQVQMAREENQRDYQDANRTKTIERLPVLEGIRKYASDHVLQRS